MRLFLFTFLFFFVTAGNSFAQGLSADQDLLQVRLIPERTHVKAGEEIWIGIEQTIKPHWHTYWKNPGDSGAEPFINWTMPSGFSVSDIQYPVPKKLPYKNLLNYGYEGQVVLLQKLTIPNTIPAGPLTLSADLDILVCKEECIPVSFTKALTLNQPGAISTADDHAFVTESLSRLPKDMDMRAQYSEREGDFVLTIPLSDDVDVKDATFFPLDWSIVENAATPKVNIRDGVLTVMQKRGTRDIADVPVMHGVLKLETSSGDENTIQIAAPFTQNTVPTEDHLMGRDAAQLTIMTALFFAFLGGVILNLMPCVFPVLSLKALSLVKLQDKESGAARINGLSYAAGVILSFVLIALVLVVLKSLGAQIGWGFQLQNPVIVALLVYVLFLVGLNFSGVFDLSLGQLGSGSLASKLVGGKGVSSSFFTGVLATIVAAPCVAPFMASAIGYALTRSAVETFLVFAALGSGLAAPYVLLCFVPAVQKFMPRPGAWMETFKQFLAFPMFASAAWLIWVLEKQAGSMALLGVLFGMVALAFGLWVLMHRPDKGKKGRKRLSLLALLSFLIALGFLPVGYKTIDQNVGGQAAQSSKMQGKKFGDVYTSDALQEALAGDQPVFVEMTAAWCITCKVNHATSLNIDSTKRVFTENNVQYLIGDWTNQDPEITKYLEEFGRSGVPIYVFYGRPNAQTGKRPAPKVLPQILTPSIVKNTVTGQKTEG